MTLKFVQQLIILSTYISCSAKKRSFIQKVLVLSFNLPFAHRYSLLSGIRVLTRNSYHGEKLFQRYSLHCYEL